MKVLNPQIIDKRKLVESFFRSYLKIFQDFSSFFILVAACDFAVLLFAFALAAIFFCVIESVSIISFEKMFNLTFRFAYLQQQSSHLTASHELLSLVCKIRKS